MNLHAKFGVSSSNRSRDIVVVVVVVLFICMTIQYKIAEKTSDMSSKTGSSREVIKKLIN